VGKLLGSVKRKRERGERGLGGVEGEEKGRRRERYRRKKYIPIIYKVKEERGISTGIISKK